MKINNKIKNIYKNILHAVFEVRTEQLENVFGSRAKVAAASRNCGGSESCWPRSTTFSSDDKPGVDKSSRYQDFPEIHQNSLKGEICLAGGSFWVIHFRPLGYFEGNFTLNTKLKPVLKGNSPIPLPQWF